MVLALSLVVIVAVAASAPALAHDNRDNKDESSNVVAYGYHGEVILNLPAGNPQVTNVTSLRLVAGDFNQKSTFGAYDNLAVYLWIPVANQFVPVAQLINVNNPALDEKLHEFWFNTPVWNPLMPNVIELSDKDFKVWKENDIIMANLSTAVKITLPFNLMAGNPRATWGNLTFNLPPLTLMFRPTAHDFEFSEDFALLPSPPLSGYTFNVKSDMSPAWVKADIPAWVRGSWLEETGHICTHLIMTSTPPKI
jgi:hypothetical protein